VSVRRGLRHEQRGRLVVHFGILITIVSIAAFGAAGTLYCKLFGRDLPTLTPKPNGS
jgi:hypothetical protein